MADQDQRTEAATPKRQGKEREKGNISKSQDLNAALMMTVGLAILGVLGSKILNSITIMLYECFTNLNPKNIKVDDIYLLLIPYVKVSTEILLPFLLILMVAGIVIVRYQVGHVFAPSKIKFDPGKLAPSKIWNSAKKMLNPFEPRSIVELLKSIAKLLIVFLCGYSVVNGRKDEILGLLGLGVVPSFAVVGSIISQMLVNMCLAMLFIGLFDKKYQDYEYNKSLKMTKQEVKDEFKDTEGDPQVKSKIRSIQRKMARQMMLSKVAKANVVVTNPTHYAVALQYDRSVSAAPILVAKGVDFLAFKIREVAQENNVPIVENPPLARALYKLVPIDGIIPSDMFVAVAEVLAYVYNMNKKGEK